MVVIFPDASDSERRKLLELGDNEDVEHGVKLPHKSLLPACAILCIGRGSIFESVVELAHQIAYSLHLIIGGRRGRQLGVRRRPCQQVALQYFGHPEWQARMR